MKCFYRAAAYWYMKSEETVPHQAANLHPSGAKMGSQKRVRIRNKAKVKPSNTAGETLQGTTSCMCGRLTAAMQPYTCRLQS